MPGFIELMSAEQTAPNGGWNQTRFEDFPKGCGFSEVPVKMPVEPAVLTQRHIIKGILTEGGVPFLLGLSFSQELSVQEITTISQQVLQQVADLTVKLEAIHSAYNYNHTDHIKMAIQLANEKIVEAFHGKNISLSVTMRFSSHRSGSNLEHMASMVSFGLGNVEIKKPLPTSFDAVPTILDFGQSALTANKPELKICIEDAFFVKRVQFLMGSKVFSMCPEYFYYNENFIDLFYQQQYATFAGIIAKLPRQDKKAGQLFNAAEKLRDAIQASHDQCERCIEEIRHLEAIINVTINLLEYPDDLQMQTRFKDMANEVEGKPNYGRLISGLMLALLGLVMAGLSIAAGIITGGTVLPLTALGVKASLPVIGTGISLLATGGFGTLLSGVGGLLAYSGRRMELSKQMMDLSARIPKRAVKPRSKEVVEITMQPL